MHRRLSSFIISLFSVCILLALFLFSAPLNKSYAASLTWDGGGSTNNWSDCTNWTTDVCPASADTAIFNSTSTKNSTVDAGFGGTIVTIDIASTYSGTITLARSLTPTSTFQQAGGTFTAAGQTLDLNIFILSGGTFTASSVSTTISNTMTISGSPTFNHNSGTFTFDGTASATLSCNNVTFNLVTFVHTTNVTKTVSSNCSLPLGNNPTVGADANADLTLSGTLSGTGTLTIGTTATTNLLTLNSGSSLSGFSGLVAGQVTISSVTYNFGTYTTFDINGTFTLNSGAVFTALSGTATFASSFTLNSGTTFNANGGTITFDGAVTATLSCNNTTFNLVTFAHTGGTIKTVGSTCNLPLGNNPTVGSDSNADLTLNGTLSGSGTLTMGTAGTGNALTLNSGSTLSGFSGLVTGALTLSGANYNFGSYTTFDVNGIFTLSSGAVFTALSGTATFGSTFTINSGTTFNANGGTVVLDTSGGVTSCNNTVFNFVIIANPAGTKTISSDCNLPVGNNPTVGAGGNVVLNGTLSGSGTLTANITTLTLNSGGALSGFNGLVSNALTVNGAYNFGSYTIFDVNAGFNLNSGAIFTAPEGTATFASNFISDSGSTFNANGGTVTFDGTTVQTLSCNNATFNLVNLHNGFSTVNADCTLPLGNNPQTGRITLNGTLTGTGTLTLGSTAGGSNFNTTAVISGFTGLVSTSGFNVDGATLNLGNYTVVDFTDNFNITAGSFTAPSGTMTVGGGGNFNHTGGTFNHNNGTIVFDGIGQHINDTTTFYNLTRTTPGNPHLLLRYHPNNPRHPHPQRYRLGQQALSAFLNPWYCLEY